MQSGNHELLNTHWRFGVILLLNACWHFGDTLLLNIRWQFGNTSSLNIHWQFWQPLITQTETIELVAFIRLEGVNYVFSLVSLILVATFIFLVFLQNRY
jgi:hypothetical protein